MNLKDFFQSLIARFSGQKQIESQKDNLAQDNSEYRRLAESIDDLELAKMFVREVGTKEFNAFDGRFRQFNPLKDVPYKTQLSVDMAKELARDFFTSVDDKFSQMASQIINGTSEDFKLNFVPKNGKNQSNVDAPSNKRKQLNIRVVDTNNISTLYALVHEITHTFDIKNGDTPTRRLLGEIAPQCMERLLDDYLLKLSDEQMQKYGFDCEILKEDILDRRIATFIARYHNADERMAENVNKEKDSRYMLAQLFCTQFEQMSTEKRIESLHGIINAIQNNDLDEACKSYGMQIGKENVIQRQKYIGELKKSIDELMLLKQTELSGSQTKWHIIDMNLGRQYKSFYHETIFDASRKKFDDDPDKRADLIIAKDGEIVGICEVDILPNGVARMCKQEEMKNLILPMGIDDTKNITNGNDMPAIQLSNDQKGKGIGRKMFELAMQYARSNGATRLSVEQISFKAKPFYEKFGIHYLDEFNGEVDLTQQEIENKAKEVDKQLEK